MPENKHIFLWLKFYSWRLWLIWLRVGLTLRFVVAMVTHSVIKFSNSCRITLFLLWSEAYWINSCWILSFRIFLSSVSQNQSPCILLFLSHPSLISILLLLIMGGFLVCAITYSGSILDLYHVSGTWRYAFLSLFAPTWLQL